MFEYLLPFSDVQTYLKAPNGLTEYEEKVRAMKLLLIGCCLLKRCKQKSPKLYSLVDRWMQLHSRKTLGDLFSIKK